MVVGPLILNTNNDKEEKSTPSVKLSGPKKTSMFVGPPERTPVPTQPPKPQTTYTDPETGKASGVEINGKTYLGLKPQDVELLLQQGEEKKTPFTEQALTEQEQLEQEEFRQEDVEQLKEQIGGEELGLNQSPIQEFQAERDKEAKEQRKRRIKRTMKLQGISREEAENLVDEAGEDFDRLIVKQEGNRLMVGKFNRLVGDIGKDVIGASLKDVVDLLNNRQETQEITSTMSELASLLPAIEGAVNNQAIEPFRALAELNSAQKDIDIVYSNIHRAAILDPKIVQTGEYIAMVTELVVLQADLRDARGTALEKLRTTTPEYNVLETQAYIRELERQ